MIIQNRKLLITGCARSGTLYASRVWQALGLDIPHERPVPPDGQMGRDGISSWLMAANDPRPPYGPSALNYQFDYVIHQVRDPLKVIASAAQFIIRANRQGKKYIIDNCPRVNLTLQQQNLEPKQQWILQAALYWHHWNLMAEQNANITVRLENIANQLPVVCERFGVKFNNESVSRVPANTNSRRLYIKEAPWIIDWQILDDIDTGLCSAIIEQANNYGYEINDSEYNSIK